jgi:hypothetical protein
LFFNNLDVCHVEREVQLFAGFALIYHVVGLP